MVGRGRRALEGREALREPHICRRQGQPLCIAHHAAQEGNGLRTGSRRDEQRGEENGGEGQAPMFCHGFRM
jgi:hypothetical protein